MQITGAFLAAHAQIVDNTLSVTGGVLDWITVPRPVVNANEEILAGVVYLVTLMQAGPDDHQKPYRMTIEAVSPAGSISTLADGEIAVDAHTGENRFWVTPINIVAHAEGRIVIINTIEGGGSVSVPVHVRIAE